MKKKLLIINFVTPFLVALFLIPNFARCQESTEKLSIMFGAETIIREVDTGKYLVYSHPLDCVFSLVIDGNTALHQMILPNTLTSVSDFEINGNDVYLCGTISNGHAYFGYFDLTTYPNSTLYYVELDVLDTLYKLEVLPDLFFNKPKAPRLIMTGKYSEGNYVIVDALHTATGWNIYYINT